MPKKKRIPRPVSTILSPAKLDSLFIIPYIHLDILLAGKAELTHLQSLVGVMNLASDLAAVRKDAVLEKNVATGMAILLAATETTPPAIPKNQVEAFLAIFRGIESSVRMTPLTTLFAAMEYGQSGESANCRDTPA